MLFSFECPSCGGRLEADSALSGGQAVCAGCGTPVAVPEARMGPGTTIGGFRLESRLGKGGMGEVFLAHQISVEREVAVKILPPDFADNKAAVRRFLQEGRLAARLDHANIATIHKAGEDDGTYYLAMAYVEGESLDQRVKREGALPEAEVLAIVRAVAEALAYAWETFQIIHRDIKPANIMVDVRQRVFLMDLGLAKSLGQESGMTLSGTILGTPQYMSPEQARGQADLGVASDIYSLGATLYHLATGTPPFDGESVPVLLHKHVYEPLPPPRERNPALSEGCALLIERMMAKRPEDRHGDWRELLAELDRPVAEEESARHVSAVTSIAPERGDVQACESLARKALARQRQSVPASGAPKGRSLRAVAAVVVVLSLVLSCLVITALRHRKREGTPAGSDGAPPDTEQTSGPAVAASDGNALPVPEHPWRVPDLGMEFVYVAPGSFTMGADDLDDRSKPPHDVRISRGYWLGKYEVTQEEYAELAELRSNQFVGARLPQDRSARGDYVLFCRRLTDREFAAGRLPDGYEYRLPTEAEWEYAARGGARSQGSKYAGSDDADEVAWHNGNSDSRTHPVGEKAPNELGLHDMSGNAHELCWDLTSWRFYAVSPGTDPVCAESGQTQVRRGGSCFCNQDCTHVAYRGVYGERIGMDCVGFRVALAPRIVLQRHAPVPRQDWTVPDLKLPMVYVAAGVCRMGSETGPGDERPVRSVRISRGFWLGKCEVTQREYENVAGANPSCCRGADRPVETVSWYDAVAFCQQLTERERQAGRLPAAYEYRLPTEAEWEYAARAGSGEVRPEYAGSDSAADVAWYAANSGGGTQPVGQRQPNRMGLRDMSGNVSEWCLDWFDPAYYSRAPARDPVNLQAASERASRGGFWSSSPESSVRVAKRSARDPRTADGTLGFRLALAPQIMQDARTPSAGEPWLVPELGMQFLPVPAGAFHMALGKGTDQQETDRDVRITRDFWLGKFEVTQGEYEAVTGDDPSGGNRYESQAPVELISWYHARNFCRALNERERTAGRLPAGYEYRLPTDAEWLYAAQGGKRAEGLPYAGSNDAGEAGWFFENSGDQELTGTKAERRLVMSNHCRPHIVGQKRPNALGFHDMSGNVSEWVFAFGDNEPPVFTANEPSVLSPGTDPVRLLHWRRRMALGGSAYTNAVPLSQSLEVRNTIHNNQFLGFRVTLAPELPARGHPPVAGEDWALPGTGMEFVYVMPGSFRMGSEGGQTTERPVREVRISRGFWLGRYEVTQEEYENLGFRNRSWFRGPRHPVERVSWPEATAFCRRVTDLERQAGRLPEGYEFRLPTEAEWEYACRAGSDDQAPTKPEQSAWFWRNSGATTRIVGLRQANEWGLFDMLGNVLEWCLDSYDAEYYSRAPGLDPVNTDVRETCVARGGCWQRGTYALRPTARWALQPNSILFDLGFRVCLGPVVGMP